MKKLIIIIFVIFLNSCHSQKIISEKESYQVKEISDLEFYELFDTSLIQNQLTQFENGLLVYEIKSDFINGHSIIYNFISDDLNITFNNFDRNINKNNIGNINKAEKYFNNIDPNTKYVPYVIQTFQNLNHAFINIYVLKKNDRIIFKVYSLNSEYKKIDYVNEDINKLIKILNNFTYE